jgi:hypothetical protein
MIAPRLRDGSRRCWRWLVARRWDLVAVATCLGIATALCWRLLATGMTACHYDWVYFHTTSEITRWSILDHGALRFWNPYTCGGIEHLGDPQTEFLSPLFPLILLFGSYLGLKLFAWAHLAIGLLGGVRLGRELGLSRPWSVAIAAVIAGAPFHLWHLYAGHIPFLQLQWLPWIVWSYLASRRQPLLALWGAAFLGVAVLSGGTYVAPFAALLLGTHALCASAIERPRWLPLAAVAIILSGGAALAAAKVLPALAFLGRFERLPLADESLSLAQLGRMFFDASWNAKGMQLLRWEYGNFLGWRGVLLALLGVIAVRRAWPWLVTAALALALTAGSFGPWSPYELLRRLPVFESLRVPSRHTLLVVLALALAAALGVRMLQAWIDARNARWRRILHPALTLLGLVVALGVVSHGRTILRANMCRDTPGPIERPARFYLVKGEFERMWQTVRQGLGTIYCRAPVQMAPSASLWLGDHEQVRLQPVTAGEARVTYFGPDRWRVHVAITKPAVLRLNQHYRPSFVTSHGRLIESRRLIGVALEPGTYDLEIAYRPREARIGLAVSGVAWLLLVTAGVIWRRKRKARPGADAPSSSSPGPPPGPPLGPPPGLPPGPSPP